MTREDILAMTAGRELDWEVAKFMDIDEKVFSFAYEAGNYNYSTDISAEWEVEAIFDQNSEIRAEYAIQLHNVLGIWLHEPTTLNNIYQFAHATPEQRCKAALLAVLEGQDNDL